MAPDELDKHRQQLDDEIESLGSWMIRFTSPVAVGLLMEFYAVLNLVVTHQWNTIIDRWGLALVTAGVVGELVVEVMIHGKARRLRTVNAEFEREANERIEVLRKENNDTTLLLAYRSIGDAPAFEEAMRKFSGTKFALEVLADSNECTHLQWWLWMALRSAGWIPVGNPSLRHQLGFGVGVLTVTEPRPSVRCAPGDALGDWLDAHRTATVTGMIRDERFESGTVLIQVGPKPETVEQQDQIRSEYARRRVRS